MRHIRRTRRERNETCMIPILAIAVTVMIAIDSLVPGIECRRSDFTAIAATTGVNSNANNMSLALNVSRLLDRLLTNYSKSLRPSFYSGIFYIQECLNAFFSIDYKFYIFGCRVFLGKPTIVDTNIRINSLGPISNFEMVKFDFFTIN